LFEQERVEFSLMMSTTVHNYCHFKQGIPKCTSQISPFLPHMSKCYY